MTNEFAGSFGRSVGRDRIEDWIVFAERYLLVRAVNGRGGSEYKLFDFALTRQLQKVHSAVDVCFSVKTRLSERRPYAGARGKMNYAIKSLVVECFLQSVKIANVCLDQAIVRVGEVLSNVCALNGRVIEIIEVIDDRYTPVTFGQQPIDKVRPDESGAAGD